MGSSQNPGLSVVREDMTGASEFPSGTAEGEPSARTRRPWAARTLVGVLVFLMVGAGLLAVGQYRRAESLIELNGALEAELAEVRDQLGAYQGHLETVRLGVADLSVELEQLQRLVEHEPTTGNGSPKPSGLMPTAE
jgi:hypothetical protein